MESAIKHDNLSRFFRCYNFELFGLQYVLLNLLGNCFRRRRRRRKKKIIWWKIPKATQVKSRENLVLLY